MSEVLSRGEELHPTVKVTNSTFESKAFPRGADPTHGLFPSEFESVKKDLTTKQYEEFKGRMDQRLQAEFNGDLKAMLKDVRNIVYPGIADRNVLVTLYDLYFREKLGVGLMEGFKAMRTGEAVAALKAEVQAAREARIANKAAQTAAKVAKKIF